TDLSPLTHLFHERSTTCRAGSTRRAMRRRRVEPALQSDFYLIFIARLFSMIIRADVEIRDFCRLTVYLIRKSRGDS
ncbi:MAG: hypothetical protein KAV82_08785, partial [Phycisphaerae bacterium]|nr:hypothetical protein [Phycisphaerae bacterium]